MGDAWRRGPCYDHAVRLVARSQFGLVFIDVARTMVRDRFAASVRLVAQFDRAASIEGLDTSHWGCRHSGVLSPDTGSMVQAVKSTPTDTTWPRDPVSTFGRMILLSLCWDRLCHGSWSLVTGHCVKGSCAVWCAFWPRVGVLGCPGQQWTARQRSTSPLDAVRE